MNSSKPTSSYSMENVIQFLKAENYPGAVWEFRNLTGLFGDDARKAVEALRPYLDPSYQNPAEASPGTVLSHSMATVLNLVAKGSTVEAIRELRDLTGMGLMEAKQARDDISAFIADLPQKSSEASVRASETIADSIYAQGIRDVSPNDFKGFPEPQETKPQIDKWMVTAYKPSTHEDWNDCIPSDIHVALINARVLCNQGFLDVRISRVIAEAKSTTTWTIEL